MSTVAYTDGACSGNPGPGGWAWAIPGGAYASGAESPSTNQRMEVMAAYDATRSIPGPLKIVSDSTYVVNCFNNKWWEGWLKRNWTNSQKKPVANRDLWEPFIALVRDRGDVTFQWVKGHSGDAMNDLVDRLAVEAAVTQQPRSGDEPPEDLGPPDKPKRSPRSSGAGASSGAASSSGAPASGEPFVSAVDGHSVVVLGHKPTELGGYDDNPLATAVRLRLREIFEAQARLHHDLVVLSGLRLGAEMFGALAAVEAGVPFVAVLPYPDPQSVWPKAAQAQFAELLGCAREVVTLQKRAPASKQQAGAALARRDAWLARNANEAVLVWDRQDPAFTRLARSLEDHLGDDVWTLDPTELTVVGR